MGLLQLMCRTTTMALAAALCAPLMGCGGNLQTLQLGLPPEAHSYSGTPQDIYSRVARGVLGCWFGARGQLKPTHIFHADLPPAEKGEPAEIVIHERDPLSGNPRGLKAMRIVIAAKSEDTTTLQFEALRFTGETGDHMRASVERWAKGDAECEPPSSPLAWKTMAQTPQDPQPSKAKGPEKKK